MTAGYSKDRVQLLVVQDLIKKLPEEDQAAIEALRVEVAALLGSRTPNIAGFALALVGLDMALVAEEKTA